MKKILSNPVRNSLRCALSSASQTQSRRDAARSRLARAGNRRRQSRSHALAKPTEDPHFVDARPSFVVQLRSADVLIDGGAELELGWLPPLLQNARNPKIEVGKPGACRLRKASG